MCIWSAFCSHCAYRLFCSNACYAVRRVEIRHDTRDQREDIPEGEHPRQLRKETQTKPCYGLGITRCECLVKLLCACFVYDNRPQIQNLLATEKHCDFEPHFTCFNLVLFCFKTFGSGLIQNYTVSQICSSFPSYLQVGGL